MRTGLLAVVCATTVATAGGVAEAAPRPVLTWSGTGCDEVALQLNVPLSTVQAALPSGYTARPTAESPELGSVLLGVASCRSLRVNGVEQPTDIVADAGILIVPRPAIKGTVYHLWQAVAAPDFRQRMARLGLDGAHVPGMAATFTAYAPAAARHAGATVPWTGNEFAIDSALPTKSVTTAAASTWVHQARRGRVRTEYRFTAAERRSGGATVRMTDGSRLARALGTPVAAGQANWLTFDMRAQVFVDR